MLNSLNGRMPEPSAPSGSSSEKVEDRSVGAVIVGAGIAGLGAALQLERAGVSVLVLERSEWVGGSIVSLPDSGRVVERGPSSFLSSGSEMMALVESLGLDSDLIQVPLKEAKRYIYADSRVQPVPMGPGSFLTTSLLSFRGKLRLMSEPFRARGNEEGDESLESFARRRLGQEAVNRLLHPMIGGIYAGDPDALSATATAAKFVALEREHGSIIRGFIKGRKKSPVQPGTPPAKKPRKSICTIRGGLSRIPQTISEKLRGDVLLKTSVTSIVQDNESREYTLEAMSPSGTVQVRTKALVVATPVTDAARLLSGVAPEVSVNLERIPVNRVGVVSTIYRRADVQHALDGFGFLVARHEDLRILGSLWHSSIFPEHCPADEVILTQFLGGARRPEDVDREDAEIVDTARGDLRQALGIEAQPVATYLTRWSPAIAQPPVGHPDIVKAIECELDSTPGLALAGNYLTGISMNDALASGLQAATRLHKQLI